MLDKITNNSIKLLTNNKMCTEMKFLADFCLVSQSIDFSILRLTSTLMYCNSPSELLCVCAWTDDIRSIRNPTDVFVCGEYIHTQFILSEIKRLRQFLCCARGSTACGVFEWNVQIFFVEISIAHSETPLETVNDTHN